MISMVIIVTLKEPNPEWNNRNVKRFSHVYQFDSADGFNAIYQKSDKPKLEPLPIIFKDESIASILITP